MFASNLAGINQHTGKDRQCSLLSNTVDGKLSSCLVLGSQEPVVSFSIKTVWIGRLGIGLMVSAIDLTFTFYSKKFTF